MIACYPGTFDPITVGHLDIIHRAASLFEEVVILLMDNPRKKCLFSAEERKNQILRSVHSDRVRVVIGTGLTVHYAKKIGA